MMATELITEKYGLSEWSWPQEIFFGFPLTNISGEYGCSGYVLDNVSMESRTYRVSYCPGNSYQPEEVWWIRIDEEGVNLKENYEYK